MATTEELQEALRRADKAGNTEDARRIAQALQSSQTATQSASQTAPAAPEQQGSWTEDGVLSRAAQGALGSQEVLGSFITSSIAETAGGLAGIGDLVAGLVTGEEDPAMSAADTVRRVSQSVPTYKPQTEAGQQYMEAVQGPLESFVGAAEGAGDKTLEATGSPGLAAGVSSAIQLAPGAVGIRKPAAQMAQRSADVKRTQGQMRESGVNLKEGITRQGVQNVRAAEGLAGSRVSKGENLDTLQESVIQAKRQAKDQVNKLYEEARATRAGVPIEEATKFGNIARTALRDFDVDDMPIVKRRLNEIQEIGKFPENSQVNLNAIADFRKRLNRNKPPANDIAQQTALGVLKGELDNFLDASFNADMISGNPAAVAKWKNANQAYKEYAKKFKEDKTIRQLAEQQATPEEISNWIYGASSVGAKKQAGSVVNRIKKIVGEDSPEFSALRQEAVFDIMEPLIREKPNFQQFVKNYDKFAKKNPTLKKELFPDSAPHMERLRNHAEALRKAESQKINFDVDKSVSQALFGHGIAKGGLRVRMARNALQLLRRAAEGSDQKRIMSEILGYETNQSILPSSPVVIGGAVQSANEEGNGGDQ